MCPICFDRLHEEDMIELNCEHRLCKDDLKTHIETNLNERSWPTCPVCVANGEDAEVIQDLEELNISQRHIEILEEMRLAEVSVRVECRRPGCPNVFWVDKAIHAQQTVLSCSVCRQRWCRDCSQIIEYGVHSCDGSTEFENLVRDNGWKHCPGCLMPIQKGEGCNHMTCRAPGCTTHFCYTCGEEITSSTVGHEISAAVEEHFSYTCSM
ncbi:hypothetical protein DL96DRAFT_106541 [Flagelloscypha sp. PMI_526]|nr:hypothetical protein DL96DRAFT_106541 [Flagelloscypha sp. PMI_526]